MLIQIKCRFKSGFNVRRSSLDVSPNLKTAKSMGIEFRATLLGTADFIIE